MRQGNTYNSSSMTMPSVRRALIHNGVSVTLGSSLGQLPLLAQPPDLADAGMGADATNASRRLFEAELWQRCGPR